MLIDGSDCGDVTRKHRYAVRRHHDNGEWRVSCLVTPRMGVWAHAFDHCPDIEAELPEGGAFWVNEWKQVWRADRAGRRALFVGEFPDLHLRFALSRRSPAPVSAEQRVYDGARCQGLRPGDDWPEHEAGMKYRYDLRKKTVWRNLKIGGDRGLGESRDAIQAPKKLLDAFRAARPNRENGRFYINEHGIVFLPGLTDLDRPVFVARINVNVGWFPRPLVQRSERPRSRGFRRTWKRLTGQAMTDDAATPQPARSPSSPDAPRGAREGRVQVRQHVGEIEPAMDALERRFAEAGSSLTCAAFEHTYFLVPDRVRARTPYYPDQARMSREHYPGKTRGDRGVWKGTRVKLGDNARAQKAWEKYSGRNLKRRIGFQVRHVWGHPWDPEAFTAGWNLCYMPFWAAPMLDEGARNEEFQSAVRQASWNL